MTEVMNIYCVLRNALLTPILKDAAAVALNDKQMDKSVAKATKSKLETEFNLCAGIRQTYSILLRLSQLENHLFDSLFKSPAATEQSPSVSKVCGCACWPVMYTFHGTRVLTLTFHAFIFLFPLYEALNDNKNSVMTCSFSSPLLSLRLM